jgi:hypothetical protein
VKSLVFDETNISVLQPFLIFSVVEESSVAVQLHWENSHIKCLSALPPTSIFAEEQSSATVGSSLLLTASLTAPKPQSVSLSDQFC